MSSVHAVAGRCVYFVSDYLMVDDSHRSAIPERLSHDFAAGRLADGQIGLATHNAMAVFDDVAVLAAASVPFVEDFEDGFADAVRPVLGTWQINAANRYHATPPAAGNTISLVETHWRSRSGMRES